MEERLREIHDEAVRERRMWCELRDELLVRISDQKSQSRQLMKDQIDKASKKERELLQRIEELDDWTFELNGEKESVERQLKRARRKLRASKRATECVFLFL